MEEPDFNYDEDIFNEAGGAARIAVFNTANRYFIGDNDDYTNFQANDPDGNENEYYRQPANIQYSDYAVMEEGWYNVMFGNTRVIRAARLRNNIVVNDQNINGIGNFVTLADLNNAFVVNEQFVVRVYSQKYNMNQRDGEDAWEGYLDSNENSLPYFVLFNNVDDNMSRCTCPDYIMRQQAENETCKHIIAVSQVQQQIQRERQRQERQRKEQRLQRLLGIDMVQSQVRKRDVRRSTRLAANSGRRLRSSGRIIRLIEKPFIGDLDHLFCNMHINKESK